MRKTLLLLWPLLMLPIAANSQVTCERQFDGPGKEVSGHPAPIFELKKPFEHPVALPNHVLALLRADGENAGKFEACRARENVAQIPPRWFPATEIKIANDELPGLLVKVADSCLWDKEQSQDVGQFWLFRQSPTGYQLIFTAHTQAFQVLNTRTAGYPDLCTSWGQYGEFYQTIYIFREGQYMPFTNGTVIFDPPPPPPRPN
jgi:hypothetical protein